MGQHSFLQTLRSGGTSRVEFILHVSGAPWAVATSQDLIDGIASDTALRRQLFGTCSDSGTYPADDLPVYPLLQRPGSTGTHSLDELRGKITGGSWQARVINEFSPDVDYRDDRTTWRLPGLGDCPDPLSDSSLAIARLNKSCTRSATTISMIDLTGAVHAYVTSRVAASEYGYLWIGSECLLVTASELDDGDVYDLTVERGCYRSVPQAHRVQDLGGEVEIEIATDLLGGISGRPATLWGIVCDDDGAPVASEAWEVASGRASNAVTSDGATVVVDVDGWPAWLDVEVQTPGVRPSFRGYQLSRGATEEDGYGGVGLYGQLVTDEAAHLEIWEDTGSPRPIWLCAANSQVYYGTYDDLLAAIQAELDNCSAGTSTFNPWFGTTPLSYDYLVQRNGLRHATDPATHETVVGGILPWGLDWGTIQGWFGSAEGHARRYAGEPGADDDLAQEWQWWTSHRRHHPYVSATDTYLKNHLYRYAFRADGSEADAVGGSYYTPGTGEDDHARYLIQCAPPPPFSVAVDATPNSTWAASGSSSFPVVSGGAAGTPGLHVAWSVPVSSALDTDQTFWIGSPSQKIYGRPAYLRARVSSTSAAHNTITVSNAGAYEWEDQSAYSLRCLRTDDGGAGPLQLATCLHWIPRRQREDPWALNLEISTLHGGDPIDYVRAILDAGGDETVSPVLRRDHVPSANGTTDFPAAIDWDHLSAAVYAARPAGASYRLDVTAGISVGDLLGQILLSHGLRPTWEPDADSCRWILRCAPLALASATEARLGARVVGADAALAGHTSRVTESPRRPITKLTASLNRRAEIGGDGYEWGARIALTSQRAIGLLGGRTAELSWEDPTLGIAALETAIGGEHEYLIALRDRLLRLAVPRRAIRSKHNWLAATRYAVGRSTSVTDPLLVHPYSGAPGIEDLTVVCSSLGLDWSGSVPVSVVADAYPDAQYGWAPAVEIPASGAEITDATHLAVTTTTDHRFSPASGRTDLSFFGAPCWDYDEATGAYEARACSCSGYRVRVYEADTTSPSVYQFTCSEVDPSAGTCTLTGATAGFAVGNRHIMIFDDRDHASLQPCQEPWLYLADASGDLQDASGSVLPHRWA